MSTITTPAPRTDTTTDTDEPDTILHMMLNDDILNSQVYGVPSMAVCGFEFVPASGFATSGGGKSVVCESCDILWTCGVTLPPNRH